MIHTFLDASVLIAAHRGRSAERDPALRLLTDASRLFVASEFLYLETMPKALYFHKEREAVSYRTYFESRVLLWVRDAMAIVKLAHDEAERCGLGAMDALHVAAAHLADAVLVTAEKPSSAIHRASLVRVVYLAPSDSASQPENFGPAGS